MIESDERSVAEVELGSWMIAAEVARSCGQCRLLWQATGDIYDELVFEDPARGFWISLNRNGRLHTRRRGETQPIDDCQIWEKVTTGTMSARSAAAQALNEADGVSHPEPTSQQPSIELIAAALAIGGSRGRTWNVEWALRPGNGYVDTHVHPAMVDKFEDAFDFFGNPASPVWEQVAKHWVLLEADEAIALIDMDGYVFTTRPRRTIETVMSYPDASPLEAAEEIFADT